MTKMINTIKEGSENNSKLIVVILALILIGFGFSYLYCIKNSIVHASLEKNYERSVNEIKFSLAELETEYYNIKNSIDENVAIEKGFILNKDPHFIKAKSVGSVVSLSHEI